MQRTATIPMGRRGGVAQGGVFPLVMAGTGSEVEITQIRANPEAKHHLEHLGFVEGARLTVVNQTAGNLIAQVKGCRIALGSHMAAKVMVAPV
jgi:ferrous iron transport protein A